MPNEPESLDNPPNDSPPIVNDTQVDPPVPAWQNIVFQANRRAEIAEREAKEQREAREAERIQRETTPIVLEPGDTFNNPQRFREVLNEDMRRMVEPLNNFVKNTNRMMQYNTLKNSIKGSSPDVYQAISRIESSIDQRFAEDESLQINERDFMRVLKEIVGDLILSGRLQVPSNNPPNPPNPPAPKVLPPPNRPSIVRNDSRTPSFDESQFDENARRLARENGMTLMEYAMIQDAPPDKAEEVWRDILKHRKDGTRYGAK